MQSVKGILCFVYNLPDFIILYLNLYHIEAKVFYLSHVILDKN